MERQPDAEAGEDDRDDGRLDGDREPAEQAAPYDASFVGSPWPHREQAAALRGRERRGDERHVHMSRFAVTCALALAMLASPVAAAPNAESPFDTVVRLVKAGDAVPATTFVDQDGRPTTLADMRGDAVAVAFIYLRGRDSCPLTTRRLGDVLARLGTGPYRIVEVTIDPDHDRPAAVRAYAREYGARPPTWLILTGDPRSVDDFDRRMGVDAVASGRDEIIHNDRLALVAPDGTVAEFVDGKSWTAADLEAQLRHIAGGRSSFVGRMDLALGAAAAFCGGLVAGRAGIGDLIASLAVLGIGVGLLVWLARRMAGAGT
jgi:cytochrome oxidase Cu insertion factor (SCO1/SenC/PrrC family)